VSSNSLIFNTEPTDEERSVYNHSVYEIQKEAADAHGSSVNVQKSMKEGIEVEPADVGDSLSIKEEAEDVVEVFEGITVEKPFHNVEISSSTSCKAYRQDKGKVNKIQVKSPNLKMNEQLSVKTNKKVVSCDINDCKLTFAHRGNLNKHIRSVHTHSKEVQ